jgi:ELWxxDGT repeat protein
MKTFLVVLRVVVFLSAASLGLVLAPAPFARAAAGPYLVLDINPSRGSNPLGLTSVGRTLYFTADDGKPGWDLWKSHTGIKPTRMVRDMSSFHGTIFGGLTDVNGMLFFVGHEPIHGAELWKSDGTKKGTKMSRTSIPARTPGSLPACSQM